MSVYGSKEEALDAIGRHSFGNDLLAERLTYVSGSDTPANTSTVPTFVGQYYLDTANEVWYKAVDTAAASDFVALNA